MGLEAFNVAPDNNGGRKKKEETEEEKHRRFSHEEAFNGSHGKEFWQKLWNRYHADSKTIHEVLEQISEHAAVLPRTAVTQMQEEDVVDFTEYADESDPVAEYMQAMKRDKERKSSPSFGGKSIDDNSGGLANIINNAK